MADPRRVSFHVGVAKYDEDAYPTARRLVSPPADARAMYNLTRSLGYTALDLQPRPEWDGSNPAPPNVKLDEAATYEAVFELFHEAAALLDEGDMCFITLSSHGVQLEDTSVPSAAENLLDEAVCLFDFAMTDDVLTGLLQGFRKKVNVILVLDCCHAGASSLAGGVLENIKNLVLHLFAAVGKRSSLQGVDARPHASALSRIAAQSAFGIAKVTDPPLGTGPDLVAELQARFQASKSLPINATVAVFQACRDTENTFDGKTSNDLSVYTRKFVDAAGVGGKTFAELRDAIAIAHPTIANCTPQFRISGDAALLTSLLKPPSGS